MCLPTWVTCPEEYSSHRPDVPKIDRVTRNVVFASPCTRHNPHISTESLLYEYIKEAAIAPSPRPSNVCIQEDDTIMTQFVLN